jgi:hypothetical protein
MESLLLNVAYYGLILSLPKNQNFSLRIIEPL